MTVNRQSGKAAGPGGMSGKATGRAGSVVWRTAPAAMGLLALLALVFTGCQDEVKRYETLSFFFDGVPPPEGYDLNPNQLYLGRTVERTVTHNLVPMLEGRSSIGRLGLFVHVTAGFGDVGFDGYWTLEMFAVQPIRIYPGVPICQIFYHDIRGDVTEYKSEKYQNNQDIQPSMLFKEWQPKVDPQRRLDFGQELVR